SSHAASLDTIMLADEAAVGLSASRGQNSRSGTSTGSRFESDGARRSRYPSGVSMSVGGTAPSQASHVSHRQNVDLPDPGSPEMYADVWPTRSNSNRSSRRRRPGFRGL